MNTTNASDCMTNMFRQASDAFRNALQTGTRIQQEALSAFARPFMSANDDAMNDARERSQKFLEGSIRLAQKNFDESQRLMDAQCRQSMELLRKAFDTARSTEECPDMFEATRQLWQQSLEAMRSSVEQVAKTNVQAIDNWTSFMGHSLNGQPEQRRNEGRPEKRSTGATAPTA